jgi:hypothetical protein
MDFPHFHKMSSAISYSSRRFQIALYTSPSTTQSNHRTKIWGFNLGACGARVKGAHGTAYKGTDQVRSKNPF